MQLSKSLFARQRTSIPQIPSRYILHASDYKNNVQKPVHIAQRNHIGAHKRCSATAKGLRPSL